LVLFVVICDVRLWEWFNPCTSASLLASKITCLNVSSQLAYAVSWNKALVCDNNQKNVWIKWKEKRKKKEKK